MLSKVPVLFVDGNNTRIFERQLVIEKPMVWMSYLEISKKTNIPIDDVYNFRYVKCEHGSKMKILENFEQAIPTTMKITPNGVVQINANDYNNIPYFVVFYD